MIEFDHITKRYNGRAAVDAVSFTIEPHSIAAIVGTSGSGKTTLLRMVNRLVEPTDGEILIDGRSIMDEPGHVLRRRIGYVIQQNGLFPHRTVAENIATVPLLLGWQNSASISASMNCLTFSSLNRWTTATAIRMNFPEGNSNASVWRVRSLPDRTSFSWTSRSGRSIRLSGPRRRKI